MANPRSRMAGFAPYVTQLTSLFAAPSASPRDPRLIAALDGEPSKQLRALVKLNLLRKTGTFFTSSMLAKKIIGHSPHLWEAGAIDPACGVGDLLIAVAQQLPVFATFEKTVEHWEKLLAGCDIHPEFVQATKLRLCLLALERGAHPPKKDIPVDGIFPHIVCTDGMTFASEGFMGTLVMNPPYTRIRAPQDCEWASGKVSAAALFVDRWLSVLKYGRRLVAILPDVLRTGSNYRAWRERVLQRAGIESLNIIGPFDEHVDVDVFTLQLLLRARARHHQADLWKWNSTKRRLTVGDKFRVHAGTIVPHRDPKSGAVRAYLHAQAAPRWGQCLRITEKIKTKRPPFFPPFVAVRRTSSPNDSVRAVGTLVLGRRPVAVENHLLVLLPKRGGEKLCKTLLDILEQPETTGWLNKRIRCRHLTVESVQQIPWI
jgi:hypothetical protein